MFVFCSYATKHTMVKYLGFCFMKGVGHVVWWNLHINTQEKTLLQVVLIF